MKEINFNNVKKILQRFKNKSVSTDKFLTDNEIYRITKIASKLPVAVGNKSIVDIGGTVFWIPIYSELLDYKEVIILCRPGAGHTRDFTIEEITGSKDIKVEIIDCDAELSKYPVEDNKIACVVSFELLEHLAGDPMNLFSESNRILQNNGYLCLTTPNVISNRNLAKIALGMHPYSWSKFTDSYADRHNREYTPFEVRELFHLSGFEIQELLTFDLRKRIYLRNKKDFILMLYGSILAFPGFLFNRVSYKMRNPFIFVKAKKVRHLKERYPSFLYEMYGRNKVQFKIPFKFLR